MKLRAAERGDLDAMALLHTEAFRGEIGPLVGQRYLRAFLGWFANGEGCVALVAQEDAQILGYVVGAPDGYGPRLTRELLPSIAFGVLANLPRIIMHRSFRRQVHARLVNVVLRRERTSPIFEATPAGCFNLIGIGTSPAARGRGIGKALVAALCERASGRPVILDVFKDNAAALGLYQGCGFRPLAEEGRVMRMIRDP